MDVLLAPSSSARARWPAFRSPATTGKPAPTRCLTIGAPIAPAPTSAIPSSVLNGNVHTLPLHGRDGLDVHASRVRPRVFEVELVTALRVRRL